MKINDKTKSIIIIICVFMVLALYTFGVQYSVKKRILKEQSTILDDTYKKGYDSGYNAGYEDSKKTIEAVYKSTGIQNTDNTEETTTSYDSENSPQVTEDTVYVTKSGKKYHKESCHTLKGNGTPISLEEAESKGKTACKICFK